MHELIKENNNKIIFHVSYGKKHKAAENVKSNSLFRFKKKKKIHTWDYNCYNNLSMTCNKKVNVACIPSVNTEDIIKPQEAEKQQEST